MRYTDPTGNHFCEDADCHKTYTTSQVNEIVQQEQTIGGPPNGNVMSSNGSIPRGVRLSELPQSGGFSSDQQFPPTYKLPYRGPIPDTTVYTLIAAGVPEALLRSAVLQVGTPEADWFLMIFGEPRAVTRANEDWSNPIFATSGAAIYVQAWEFKPDTKEFALLIAHEIRHVEQMQADPAFDIKYPAEMAAGFKDALFQGKSISEAKDYAYNNVSYEKDAINYAYLIGKRLP